jgi:NADPH:quinone reductase-like Zn-dependent oxidoreductase
VQPDRRPRRCDGRARARDRRAEAARRRRQRGGLLCAYGFSAAVAEPPLTIAWWIARLYLWSWLSRDKRARFYSINAMRLRHPDWFKQDLEHLFGLLAAGTIRPRVAERISFDGIVDAHRRLEAMGLTGKIVLCP